MQIREKEWKDDFCFLLKLDRALWDPQEEVCPAPEAGKKFILLRRVRIGPTRGCHAVS